MKTLAVILAFFASFAAHAEWFDLTTSGDKVTTYSYKMGSLKKSKTEIQIIIRATHNNGDNPDFNIVRMTEADCQNEFGLVRFFDTSNTFMFSNAYVKNGGTVAQYLGDFVCELRKDKKGMI
jgi:hypothetical protein